MGLGLNPVNALPAASIIRGYDKTLQMITMLDDIYETLSGDYLLDKKSVPDAIRMKMNDNELSKSNNVTITLLDHLDGMATYDPNPLIGNEQMPRTKTFTCYSNIFRKAVGSPGYGPDKKDAEGYGLYDKWIDKLGVWNKEHHGLSIRQALLERFGESLVHGRTSSLCPRAWTPNILVAGLGRRAMKVTYNANNATYTTNIINAILASGGGSISPLVTQTLNQPNLSNANILALMHRITQISIPGLPGGKGWILTHSEEQGMYLGDPAWSARNLGSLYTATACLNEKVQNWPGVMGAYKNFLLVQDVRQPTLIISGTSSPFGMTAGYVEPGDEDERQKDNINTRDTATILGKAAVFDWTREALRHIKQDDDYEYQLGHGTSKVEGVTMPIYDQQNPDKGTLRQFSSMQMVLGLPEYV